MTVIPNTLDPTEHPLAPPPVMAPTNSTEGPSSSVLSTGAVVTQPGMAGLGATDQPTAQAIASAIATGQVAQPTTPAAWQALYQMYRGGRTPTLDNAPVTSTAAAPVTASQPASGGVGGGGTVTPSSGRAGWAAAVLTDAGLPVTAGNVDNFLRWMTAENTVSNWAPRNNPLNASLGTSAADGTAGYASMADSAHFTALMLRQSNMGGIYQALASNANASAFSAAVVASPWASSHYGGDPNHIAEINPPDLLNGAAVPAGPPPSAPTPMQRAQTGGTVSAVSFAMQQIGTPYVWGGEDPSNPGHPGAFDCSGLVQFAYKQAGVNLPRVAQDQYNATPKLAPGQALQPCDLVFFGTSTRNITHVGIYIGNGEMVDAPHTGAQVRVENYQWADYVGATRPGDPTGQTMQSQVPITSTSPQTSGTNPATQMAQAPAQAAIGSYYTALNATTQALEKIVGAFG